MRLVVASYFVLIAVMGYSNLAQSVYFAPKMSTTRVKDICWVPYHKRPCMYGHCIYQGIARWDWSCWLAMMPIWGTSYIPLCISIIPDTLRGRRSELGLQ